MVVIVMVIVMPVAMIVSCLQSSRPRGACGLVLVLDHAVHARIGARLDIPAAVQFAKSFGSPLPL